MKSNVMKFKQFLSDIKDLWKAFWIWLHIRPRNFIVSFSTLAALIYVGYLLIWVVLPSLAGLALLISFFGGDSIKAYLAAHKPPPPPSTLEDNGVCWEVTIFMYDVLLSVREILSEFINLPKSPNDLYDPAAFKSTYSNACVLRLRLLRRRREITPDDCDFLKEAIQAAINARIRDGYLQGYLWAVQSAFDVPLLKLIRVEVSEMYLHIGILLTNNPVSVQAARLSDKPSLVLLADDTDPLFKGGD